MKILVVEDNPISAALFEKILEAAGYDALPARSGEHGLKLIEKHEDIALVVCDMGLPGMSGIDFIAAMRAMPGRGGLPVIMCTITSDVDNVRAAARSGAVGYLLKPVNPAAFLNRVRDTIGPPFVPEPEATVEAEPAEETEAAAADPVPPQAAEAVPDAAEEVA